MMIETTELARSNGICFADVDKIDSLVDSYKIFVAANKACWSVRSGLEKEIKAVPRLKKVLADS